MSKISKGDIWSDNKRKAAELMAEGLYTQTEIAKSLDIRDETISRWKREPEFLQRVDDLTLALERHQLAGMLRRLDEQQDKTTVGKTDWLKIEEFKAKLRGFDKVKVDVNHSGEITHKEIVSTPDVLEAANNLAKKIAESK